MRSAFRAKHIHDSMFIKDLVLGPKKYICVFIVTCQKNLGSVGRH
jgi:hypothetical protein